MFKGLKKQIKKAEGGIKKHGFAGAVVKEAGVVVNNAEKQIKKAEGGIAKHGAEEAMAKQVGQWLGGPDAPQAEQGDFVLEEALRLSKAEAVADAKNAKINELFEGRLELMKSLDVNPTPEQLVQIRAMAQRDVEAAEAKEAQREMAIQEEVLKKMEMMKLVGVEPTPEQEVQFREIAERDLFGASAGEEEHKDGEIDLAGDGGDA